MDFNGTLIVSGTPKGMSPESYFWELWNDPNFSRWKAPSWVNPFLSPSVIEDCRKRYDPRTFSQEICAEFLDWSGSSFFSSANFMLPDENGFLDYPDQDDPRLLLKHGAVVAVVDSAAKTGRQHDGSAIAFGIKVEGHFFDDGLPRFTIVDWMMRQVGANDLLSWVRTEMVERYRQIAREFGLFKELGFHVEDASSGQVLLPHLQSNGIGATAIPGKLVHLGKDERARHAGQWIHGGQVTITKQAAEKRISYRGKDDQNPFLHEVFDFRLADVERCSWLLKSA